MSAELGFFDYLECVEQLAARPTALDQLNQCIDWSGFESVLNSKLNYEERSKGGCKPYKALLMFKVLILQKYYDLSEEDTEFQILDRFSFQRFLGLSVSDKVPDKKTIWLFKQRLGEDGIQALFDYFSTVLRAQGLSVNEGKIVDASFVEVPRQQNASHENMQLKDGEIPEDWQKNPARLRPKDADARWTTKCGHHYFGYKNHIKVNESTKLIGTLQVTAASAHDSATMKDLVEDSDKLLYADSGELMLHWLRTKGIESQVNERAHRNRPLSDEQKQTNRGKSCIRSREEHVFGFLTNSMKTDFIRCIDLSRTMQSIGLGNLIYNMFRFKQPGGTMLS